MLRYHKTQQWAKVNEPVAKTLCNADAFRQAVAATFDGDRRRRGLIARALTFGFFFKGRKVVEVLIASKINYSKLKGLFGNEDGTSRCSRLTVAAELWLLCGSVEGALKTLRGNGIGAQTAAIAIWSCHT